MSQVRPVRLSLRWHSLPDAWAIDQVFPLIPIHRLDEQPDRRAVIVDLTCDSDGCIEQYVDQDGVESTLMLHEPNGEPYLLGIFLVGAYQEILGDMHNLFGDTDAVDVCLDGDGGHRITHAEHGDSVDEVLRYVHFDPKGMIAAYRRRINAAGIRGGEAERLLAILKAGLLGSTYLG